MTLARPFAGSRLPVLLLLLAAGGCMQLAPPEEIEAQSSRLAASPAAPGTWTKIATNPFDNGRADALMLLTDGTVLANAAGADLHRWARLIPDATGSYANGRWAVAASTQRARQFYPAFVLADGRVWVGGGEVIIDPDQNMNATELYDPIADQWTPGPDGLYGDIGDVGAAMLADGRILVGNRSSGRTQIYNPTTNAFTAAADLAGGDFGSEGNWSLLADGSVLNSIRVSQRYLPTTNQWVATAVPPITMSSVGEHGPIVVLQDGRTISWSDHEDAAYYTVPATLGGPGSWTTAPRLPDGFFGDDTPAVIEPSGNVLIAATFGHFGVASFFELDPLAGTLTNIHAPVEDAVGFVYFLLPLPNGEILVAGGGSYWVYTPVGTPQDAWRPTVSSVTASGDGSYTLVGTQLNGRSMGGVFGDDGTNASNYPIVYLKDATGRVIYLRSFNHSTMGIRTGSTPVSTHFRVPAGVPSGTYDLFVSAVGISSATAFPFTFTASATTTLAPVADAYVRDGGSAGTNFGADPTLQVKNTSAAGNNRRTFLKFDLSGVTGPVTSAKLRLFGNHATATTADSAFAVANNTWTESGINWNNKPALGAKQGASVTITTTAKYYEWDVTAFVAAQRSAGVDTVSLAVTMDAQTNNAPDTFNARESASNQPQLVVSAGGGAGNGPPSVATPAAASPSTIAGNTSALSVLGADDGGEAALTYSWTTVGTPPAPVAFAPNGTNAAKNSTATFGKAGPYTLRVEVRDAGGLFMTSTVVVTVSQTLTSIAVSPGAATVPPAGTQAFAATANDQFGMAITPGPAVTWSVAGGGTIDGSGLFTAGATSGGPFSVTARSGSITGSASVTVAGATTTTLAPTADAYVRDGASAAVNFGNDPTLAVKNTTAAGNNRRAFLKFDLGAITGTVSSAKLRLFGNHPAATLDSAFAVPLNSWTETAITWNNQPPLGAKQGASVSIGTALQYYELDVTSFVAAQKSGGITTVSLAVTMDAQNNNAPGVFNSRQATSNRPELVVTATP
jgi:hypothetical protein